MRCGTSSVYIREGQQGVELAAAIDKRNPARAADCNAADSGPSTVLSTRRSLSSLAQSCRSPTGKRTSLANSLARNLLHATDFCSRALLGGAMCIIAFVTPAPSARDILTRLGETVSTG